MYPTQRFQLSESHTQGRRRTLISLTPLIDVVFILLIFFMLATSFLDWRVVQIELPKSASSSTSVEESMIVKILDKDFFELDGGTVNIDDLRKIVKSRVNKQPDIQTFIQPGSGVQLQDSISLIDQLKIWGVHNIGFVKAAE